MQLLLFHVISLHSSPLTHILELNNNKKNIYWVILYLDSFLCISHVISHSFLRKTLCGRILENTSCQTQRRCLLTMIQIGQNLKPGDLGSIPRLGRSPGGGNDNPFQYSCLEDSMDIRAWRATVHGLQRVRHNWASHTLPLLSASC